MNSENSKTVGLKQKITYQFEEPSGIGSAVFHVNFTLDNPQPG
jgi:hypothetical protein